MIVSRIPVLLLLSVPVLQVAVSRYRYRYVYRYSSEMARYICVLCLTMCLFISPDLDGHRAPKMKY